MLTTYTLPTVHSPQCPAGARLSFPLPELGKIHDAIDDVIWAASFDPFQCHYANRACEKVFGYTAEEMIADNELFPNCVFDDDKEQFYASVALAYQTGSANCIFRIRNKKGEIKVLRAQAILAHTGEPDAPPILTGIASDITALLSIRNQLKEKASELETILESINDAFFTIDKSGNITYINKALELLLNVKREDVLGHNAWELFPAALETHFYKNFEDCLNKGTVARFEDYYSPLDKWFSVNVYPTAKGLSVYCTDVTEERKAKAKLLETKQNLRAIIDNTGDLIWSVDRNYNILASNQAYRRVVAERYGTKAIEGKYLFERIPEDKKNEWKAYIDRGLAGESYSILHLMDVNGRTAYSKVRFNPILDSGKKVVGVSCFSTDVTVEHRQKEEIENKNKVLTEIANLQSHQVRGPIATILGLAQLIDLTTGPQDPHNADIIRGLVEAAGKLDRIVTEIDSRANV